jgi:transposase InsO family protein
VRSWTTDLSSRVGGFGRRAGDYRLHQEFITLYTPEQNGIVKRFFRSLKEDCVWQHSFPSFVEAHRAVRRWIGWYSGVRSRRSAISARASIGRINFNVWLDHGGALQPFVLGCRCR